jgi:hypothetical protein
LLSTFCAAAAAAAAAISAGGWAGSFSILLDLLLITLCRVCC